MNNVLGHRGSRMFLASVFTFFIFLVAATLVFSTPAAANPQTKGGISGPSAVEVGKPATYRFFFKLKPGTKNATLRIFWGDGIVETRKVKVSCGSGKCVTKPARFVRWHKYEVTGKYTVRARILEKKNVVGKNLYKKKIVVSAPPTPEPTPEADPTAPVAPENIEPSSPPSP
jgi:hypothetical protein